MVQELRLNILFITHPYPNYVPDLLLHGLRKLLGPAVVDFPRKDCLYEGVLGLGVCPDDQRSPGWFPDDNGSIDRDDIVPKIRRRVFDLILCDIRAAEFIRRELKQVPDRLVLIDGEDKALFIPPGPYIVCRRETDGSDYSIPLPMALPEEILLWISSYDRVPKRYSIGFLGSTAGDERRKMTEALASLYPDTLFSATNVPSCDNPKPSGRLGRDEYYRAIQSCCILLSLPGAGYDTFRFWENAACSGLHLAFRSPLFIPNAFKEGEQLFRFSGFDELRAVLDAALEQRIDLARIMESARRHLTEGHLTIHRAKYLLEKAALAFGPGSRK
jgi:hypothetical protein